MENVQLKPEAKPGGGRLVDRIVMFASAAVALLYFYTAKEGQLPIFQQRGILLAFCYVLVFIKYPMLRVKGRRPYWSIAIDVLLSVATILMVIQLIQTELGTRPGAYHRPTTYDYALGLALLVATLEATRRMLGLVLPVLAVVFFLYALWGQYLPGLLYHLPIRFALVIYYIALTPEGVFGVPLYVVSTIVVAFLIFAAMLQKMGLMRFFIDLASGLMGGYRGGPAKIAVVSSAFMAMMSGSAVANVVSTGSFTIPLMKSIGYRPNFAGAVEACASTGGVTTPPVMGAAAFIMAEILGVSYWSVVVAAVLPAVLYYWGVYTGVDLEAMKLGLKGLPREQLPNPGQVMLKWGYMLLPVFVLIYYLGYVRASATMAAFWGTVTVFAVGLIRKETRRGVHGLGLVEGMASAIKDCMVVVASVACAGIVIGTLAITGLGLKVSIILTTLSGGNLLLLLVLAAVVCMILGMGVTTTAVYILVAMIVAPAIIKLGVPPLAAHLFVFYLANLGNITPPVCIAVFAACGISGGDPWKTGWQSCRLGAVLFVIPFFWSYNQSLIWQGSAADIILATVTALLGTTALASAFANHSWWGRISVPARVLLGLGGVALIHPALTVSIGGTALVVGAVLYQVWGRRAESTAPARAEDNAVSHPEERLK